MAVRCCRQASETAAATPTAVLRCRPRQQRALTLSRTTRFALSSLRVGQTDEQAIEVVFSRLGNLASFNEDVIKNSFLRLTRSEDQTQGRDVGRQLFLGSSKFIHTPGSPYRTAPWTRNSIANKLLPLPALPQTRETRPLGGPARQFIRP